MAFLEQYEQTGEEHWKNMVETTLQNQYTKLSEIKTNYNLFDPIEGGFHRYGNARDYTPPHYEKMLYDNAKLLQLYSHLAELTSNPLAVEVSKKTFAFLQNWYDEERGGFAGNSDAFDEHHYYGKSNRPEERPRIEWTKYTDWNSDAVIAFFAIGEQTNNQKATVMAEKTLTFFLEEMVDENGPFHYMSVDNERGVQGNLPDSASLLVASVEGYQKTEKQEFLDGAEAIAQYALANLYDWNGGGFFERNSPNAELYAPDELQLTEIPPEENGMIAYALLLLFEKTDDVSYLNAAIKTVGRLSNRVPHLDTGFFLYKAAQYMEQQDSLKIFAEHADEIRVIDEKGLESFFMNRPAAPQKFIAAQEPSTLQSPFLLLLLIALLAGLLSFLSPCTLPILPAYFAAMLKTDPKKQIVMSLSFLAGLSLVFSLLGMSATAIGSFLREHLTIFTQVIGIAIMGFGVMTLMGKGFGGLHIAKEKPRTAIGSFLFGGALGLSWTPCVGPILVALLALASTLDSSIQGGVLLLVYALGLGVPLIVFSSLLQRLPRDGKCWRVLNGKWSSVVAGLIFVIFGYLIFSGTLYTFNQYLGGTEFQKWFFTIENWLLQTM